MGIVGKTLNLVTRPIRAVSNAIGLTKKHRSRRRHHHHHARRRKR